MSMTRAERQLVHAALTWATRNGNWCRGITRHAYATPDTDLVWWEPEDGRVVVDLEKPPMRCQFNPESPRQAVDVLAALGLLPAHYSTLYAIGRAAGALAHWTRKEVTPCTT
jgi:hypothetical protein